MTAGVTRSMTGRSRRPAGKRGARGEGLQALGIEARTVRRSSDGGSRECADGRRVLSGAIGCRRRGRGLACGWELLLKV